MSLADKGYSTDQLLAVLVDRVETMQNQFEEIKSLYTTTVTRREHDEMKANLGREISQLRAEVKGLRLPWDRVVSPLVAVAALIYTMIHP